MLNLKAIISAIAVLCLAAGLATFSARTIAKEPTKVFTATTYTGAQMSLFTTVACPFEKAKVAIAAAVGNPKAMTHARLFHTYLPDGSRSGEGCWLPLSDQGTVTRVLIVLPDGRILGDLSAAIFKPGTEI